MMREQVVAVRAKMTPAGITASSGGSTRLKKCMKA
jgi:hypothetical protein